MKCCQLSRRRWLWWWWTWFGLWRMRLRNWLRWCGSDSQQKKMLPRENILNIVYSRGNIFHFPETECKMKFFKFVWKIVAFGNAVWTAIAHRLRLHRQLRSLRRSYSYHFRSFWFLKLYTTYQNDNIRLSIIIVVRVFRDAMTTFCSIAASTKTTAGAQTVALVIKNKSEYLHKKNRTNAIFLYKIVL